MRDTIDMAREAGIDAEKDTLCRYEGWLEPLKAFEALVRADERMSFYGQDKPAECADGCPPNQICDYCQVVAPAKAMILAEREACARVCEDAAEDGSEMDGYDTAYNCSATIRARKNT